MSNSGSFSRASSYSPTESVEHTPLQLAVLKGSLDEARFVSCIRNFPSVILINLKIPTRKW